jgi:hypothetical protein
MPEVPTIPSIGTLVRLVDTNAVGEDWRGQLALVSKHEHDKYGEPEIKVWIRRISDGGEGFLYVSSLRNCVEVAEEAPDAEG